MKCQEMYGLLSKSHAFIGFEELKLMVEIVMWDSGNYIKWLASYEGRECMPNEFKEFCWQYVGTIWND